MTEPSLALQQAIRTRLLASPAVLSLVPAGHIRDGGTRPEKFPTIIIGDGQTVLGHYTGRRNVTVYLDVLIWCVEDGLAAAKEITDAVSRAIGRSLDVPGFQLSNGVDATGARYMRDPDGHGHAVLSVEAFMSGEFAE